MFSDYEIVSKGKPAGYPAETLSNASRTIIGSRLGTEIEFDAATVAGFDGL